MSRIIKTMLKRSTARGLFLAACILSLAILAFVGIPAFAATTPPVLWTAGGLDAGNTGAGQAARIATDASGNVAVVSGPAGGRDLAVTSYTAAGAFRWRSTVTPTSGTFVGDWVAAAANGDVVAIGHNTDSQGRPITSTMVRFAPSGTLLWRVDFSQGFFPAVARLLVDASGNEYVAWNAVGSGLFVQKYSPTGALLWSQQDLVSGGFAVASSLALSPDGADVVVTGSVSGGATWITTLYDAATGAQRWGVAAPEGLAALDVVVDATRVYVTGQGVTGAGTPALAYHLTVVAYDRATGVRLWRTDKRPADGNSAAGLRMAMMPDGSLVVTGQANRGFLDWYTVAFETTGAVRWEAVRDGGLNTDEIPAAVLVLANGTTVVTGRGGPNLPGGFIPGVTVGYSSNGTLLWEAFSNLATVWATALPNGDVCATGGYDALITCWQVSGGVVTTPSPTPGPTTTPTNTPPPPTPTATPAGSINTGFISPSANAPQTTSAGDKNGYESSPGNAYTNDSLVATDTNSGTNTSTSCTNSGKDRHHFFNFNFNIPTTAVIQGIQVRLDARADATAGSPNICVEMSWDGGTTWTLAKSTTTLSTSEATYILGSVSDTWGRTWNSSDFSNVNFRLRVTDVASNTRRDFFLDYVAANVTYTVGDAPVNQSPTAVVSADVTSGASPLAVNFTGSASSDPDGTIASYAWNFGDGNSTTGATAFNTYTTAGTYVATLTVTDNEGATASDTVTIVVTDPAAGCSSNCARVSNISLAVRGNGMLAATVTVVNENGAALVGAVVSATWTLPNGATSSATGTVSNRGTALFNLGDNGPGTYTLTVTNVSQSGYTFDAPNSILSGNVVK